jgi:hypothetical protein
MPTVEAPGLAAGWGSVPPSVQEQGVQSAALVVLPLLASVHVTESTAAQLSGWETLTMPAWA